MKGNGLLLKIIVHLGVPALAALLTWLTGLSAGFEKGFPIPWTTIGVDCPLPGSGIEIQRACFLRASYNWGIFGIDVLIYSIIAYIPLIVHEGYQLWKLRGATIVG